MMRYFSTLLLVFSLIFACGCGPKTDPNLEYITDFYGVNKEYVNTVAHPDDSAKSLRVYVKWDEKGKASYRSETIARDTASENPGAYVLMPEPEFHKDSAFIEPVHAGVETIALVYSNGALSAQIIEARVPTPICCVSPQGGLPYCTMRPFWSSTSYWSGWSCGFNSHCIAVPCIGIAVDPIFYYEQILD